MAWYICEIALYHKEFVSTKPSVMARASLALARGILSRPEVSDGAWDHVENLTLLSLSQHLNQTSSVLSRKYASPHMSRVSSTLEQFLAQQAAIAKRATPPTPPYDSTPPKMAADVDYIYNTPQKVLHGVMANGYPTPPETPEDEYFLNGNGAKGHQAEAPRRPVTPTPICTNPYIQQQQQQHQFQVYHQNMIQ